MSRSVEDKIPEIQSSFVQNFLKGKLGKEALISSNFRKEYSKCLSLFLFYLATMQFICCVCSKKTKIFLNSARHNQGESKKKLTKNCILKGLTDIGFEDFADQLQEMQIEFKQTLPQPIKKQVNKEEQEQNTANNEGIQEQQNVINNEDNQEDEVQSDGPEDQMEEMNDEREENKEKDESKTNILDQIISSKKNNNDEDEIYLSQQYEEMF